MLPKRQGDLVANISDGFARQRLLLKRSDQVLSPIENDEVFKALFGSSESD